MPETVDDSTAQPIDPPPRVHIVTVCWNNWPDTINCLDTLLRLQYENYSVVIINNGSTDNSFAKLSEEVQKRAGRSSIQQTDPETTEQCAGFDYAVFDLDEDREIPPPGEQWVTIITTDHNRGFGAGNNIGIRYALQDPHCEYFWLLNNDTRVDSAALTALVRHAIDTPNTGICGSTILDYDSPHRIQARGGIKYDPWHARGEHLCRGEPFDRLSLRQVRDLEAEMDAVQGASMLVSREFVQIAGLMPEHLFLYFEELEWAESAKGAFRFAYAQDSIVFHKEGGTMKYNEKSEKATYFFTRNRLRHTCKWHPAYKLPVTSHLLMMIAKRLLLGDFFSARIMWKALKDARTGC